MSKRKEPLRYAKVPKYKIKSKIKQGAPRGPHFPGKWGFSVGKGGICNIKGPHKPPFPAKP